MSLEGQQLGRYRLLRLLGSGGMGEVYLAEDARIAQQVAIKVIRHEVTPYPDTTSAKEATRLFEREAKAIARLDHPNILPLFAFGEEDINGELLSYLVMPYRKEGTLATWLRQRGSTDLLSPGDVAHLLIQAADALQHAHDQQIIHQDIKPANFLIRSRKDQPSRPDLLLADFGIAKLTSATASASQSIRGTPTYMAPEQWDGQPVPATDQYALAIMAYELLTGHPPFQGGPGQVMRQHFFTQPQPPSAFNGRLSPAIDAVLLRALSKQAADRFATVVDFAKAFQQAVQDTGQPIRNVVESHKDEEAIPTETVIAPKGEDITATLAISPSEAQSGTTRTVTLPGGQSVSISIPAGAQDHQLIRLEGQGALSTAGGPPGSLVLTLAITSTEELPLLTNPDSLERTVAASHPDLQSPTFIASIAPGPTPQEATIPASHPNLGIPAVAPSRVNPQDTTVQNSHPNLETTATTPSNPHYQEATIPASRPLFEDAAVSAIPPAKVRQGISRSRAILLIGLALLVVVGSVGVLFTTLSNQAANNTNATATAQVNATFARGTVNRLNDLATMTASSAQETAQETAVPVTLTAKAQATNTAAQNLYIQMTRKAPALDDPLSNNSKGYNWDKRSTCYFGADGAYHAVRVSIHFAFCFAENTNFDNFVYQAQVRFSGNNSGCGGIIFRSNSTHSGSYYFDICNLKNSPDFECRFFPLVLDSSGIPSGTALGNFPCTVNESNLVSVIVTGSNFYFYMNNQYVGQLTDSTHSHGQIGVAADFNLDVAFSNAKVWIL